MTIDLCSNDNTLIRMLRKSSTNRWMHYITPQTWRDHTWSHFLCTYILIHIRRHLSSSCNCCILWRDTTIASDNTGMSRLPPHMHLIIDGPLVGYLGTWNDIQILMFLNWIRLTRTWDLRTLLINKVSLNIRHLLIL